MSYKFIYTISFLLSVNPNLCQEQIHVQRTVNIKNYLNGILMIK